VKFAGECRYAVRHSPVQQHVAISQLLKTMVGGISMTDKKKSSKKTAEELGEKIEETKKAVKKTVSKTEKKAKASAAEVKKAVKKTAKKVEKSAEEAAEAVTKNVQTAQKSTTKVVEEVVENVENIAGNIPEQAGKMAATLLHKLKEGVENVKDVGEKLVENISATAQNLTDKYKTQTELGKLKEARDELLFELGKAVVQQVKTEGSIKTSFFRRAEIKVMLDKIEEIERKINEQK
jgi:Asp-tRNA(Asn)/Glu-tRNA(Gln) amidotransferase A subunit family amidase